MLKIFLDITLGHNLLDITLGQKWGIKNALSRTASFIILPACPKESILIISVRLPRVYHCYPLVTARNYFLSSMSLRNCSSDMDNLAAASEIVRIPSQTSCTKVSILPSIRPSSRSSLSSFSITPVIVLTPFWFSFRYLFCSAFQYSVFI